MFQLLSSIMEDVYWEQENDCTLNIVKWFWNDSDSASSLMQENLNGYDFCFLHKKNDAGGNRYNVYNQLI